MDIENIESAMNLIFIPCTKILKKGYLSRGKETDRDRVFPAKNTVLQHGGGEKPEGY